MRHLLWLSVLLNLLLAGCGPGQRSKHKLQETVLLFNEGVRWGRLQDVLPRVHPDSAAHFLEMHKEFGKEIQISDYELVNALHDPKKKKADVTVQITWYRQSEMVVKTTVLIQHWEEQEREREWIMLAEEYVSGDRF